jgi:DNA-binding NtrC family response regulator
MNTGNQDDHGHILLADDEPAFQRLGGTWLRNLGHRVTVAADATHALRAFIDERPDVVLLDLSMPPRMDPEAGLDLIPAVAPAPVIVLTGHAHHDLALKAMERGAWDFVAKPIEPDMLRVIIGRAVRKAKLDAELTRLRDMVHRLGPTGVAVIILVPTGTGKELVARALHATSRRARGPFVPVHCGALSAELLESELFGHLKGSFTGAHRDQPGLVETAHHGTLFLDEGGERPVVMQVKLLRFLQEGTFVPVGGRVQKRVDVRVLAATHRDIEAMVAQGSFRDDLFYRLKGVVVRTPALAERREDVPILAALFLRRAAVPNKLTQDALAWLAERTWPGNVRELRAVVELAAALSTSGSIDAASLRFAAGESEPVEDAALHSEPLPGALDDAIAQLETRMLRDALAAPAATKARPPVDWAYPELA